MTQDFAPFWFEQLAVVEAANRPRRIKDDRGGHHRPKQAAPANFVYPGNAVIALPPQITLDPGVGPRAFLRPLAGWARGRHVRVAARGWSSPAFGAASWPTGQRPAGPLPDGQGLEIERIAACGLKCGRALAAGQPCLSIFSDSKAWPAGHALFARSGCCPRRASAAGKFFLLRCRSSSSGP